MTEFYKSELKDRFLRYTMERDDYVQPEELYTEFLSPNYQPGYVLELLDEIIEYDPELFDVISANGARIFMLSATPQTFDFIEKGGFKSLFVQEEEKWESFLKHLSIDLHRSDSSRGSGDDSSSIGFRGNERRDKKIFMSLLAVIAFSFLYSLIGTIGSLTAPQGISQREFEHRLDELQKQHRLEMQTLREQIQEKGYTQVPEEDVPDSLSRLPLPSDAR